MVQALPTDSDSSREKLVEIATILALGLQRLSERKSSPNSPSETDSPLDCERPFCRHETGNFEDSRQ
jgi:hypothetical protein